MKSLRERRQIARRTVRLHGRKTSWRERIVGGEAARCVPSDFSPKALEDGIVVELEHTDDPLTAMEVAMDHLAEDPGYYPKLATIHHENPRERSRRIVNPFG